MNTLGLLETLLVANMITAEEYKERKAVYAPGSFFVRQDWLVDIRRQTWKLENPRFTIDILTFHKNTPFLL